MSVIHLVRHGQASFGSHDYDRLSALGIRQVERLQSHWRALGELPTAVYCGPLQRQRQTAHLLAAHTDTRVIEHPAFKEFDATRVLDAHALALGLDMTQPDAPPSLELPKTSAQTEVVSPLPADPLRLRRFQERLEAATLAWVRDELPSDVESWTLFQRRVVTAMEEIFVSSGRRQQVVICTSAGVIAAAMGHLLGLQGEASIRLSWVLLNASVSSVLFDERRRSVLRFNALPHLEQAEHRGLLTRI